MSRNERRYFFAQQSSMLFANFFDEYEIRRLNEDVKELSCQLIGGRQSVCYAAEITLAARLAFYMPSLLLAGRTVGQSFCAFELFKVVTQQHRGSPSASSKDSMQTRSIIDKLKASDAFLVALLYALLPYLNERKYEVYRKALDFWNIFISPEDDVCSMACTDRGQHNSTGRLSSDSRCNEPDEEHDGDADDTVVYSANITEEQTGVTSIDAGISFCSNSYGAQNNTAVRVDSAPAPAPGVFSVPLRGRFDDDDDDDDDAYHDHAGGSRNATLPFNNTEEVGGTSRNNNNSNRNSSNSRSSSNNNNSDSTHNSECIRFPQQRSIVTRIAAAVWRAVRSLAMDDRSCLENISLLFKDAHQLLFFATGSFLECALRMVNVRLLNAAPPRYKSSLRVLAWLLGLRLSMLAYYATRVTLAEVDYELSQPDNAVEQDAGMAGIGIGVGTEAGTEAGTGVGTGVGAGVGADTEVIADYNSNSGNASSKSKLIPPSENMSSTLSRSIGVRKCALCIDALSHPAATPCGHIFCWDCIIAYGASSARSRSVGTNNGIAYDDGDRDSGTGGDHDGGWTGWLDGRVSSGGNVAASVIGIYSDDGVGSGAAGVIRCPVCRVEFLRQHIRALHHYL